MRPYEIFFGVRDKKNRVLMFVSPRSIYLILISMQSNLLVWQWDHDKWDTKYFYRSLF